MMLHQPRDLGDQYLQLVQRLLQRCQEYVVARESNITYSHPIFGWFAVQSSRQLLDVMPMVLDQLWFPIAHAYRSSFNHMSSAFSGDRATLHTCSRMLLWKSSD